MRTTKAELALYHDQLNFVEDILVAHPDFLDVLTEDEQVIFDRYFQPNWDQVSDFRQQYLELTTKNPTIVSRANTVMAKLLTLQRVNHQGKLLPPDLPVTDQA